MKQLISYLLLCIATVGYTQDTTAASGSAADTIPPDPNWKFEGITKLHANQAQFRNWQAGGINSLSWTAYLDISADYKKNGWSWDHDLQLGFGQMFQDDTDWRKTDDVLSYMTTVGRAIDSAQKWELIATASFKTQFANGFEYPNDSIKNSTWLAPGYVNAGLGFRYTPKPFVKFSLTPVGTKITIVNDQNLADQGTYGNEGAVFDTSGQVITPGKNIRTEFGGAIGIEFDKEIVKNVSYKSTLSLFSNYLENPQNIDVTWSNLINFKVNDLINFSLTLDMIYDDDINITEYNSDDTIKSVGPRLQIKQLLGFGINYTIRNYTPK